MILRENQMYSTLVHTLTTDKSLSYKYIATAMKSFEQQPVLWTDRDDQLA